MLSALVGLLPLLTPLGGASAAAPTLYVSPASPSTLVNSELTVDLMADCGTNADGVSLVVSFDPRLLQVQEVIADVSAFRNTLLKTTDNTLGRVYYDAGALTCHQDGDCPSGLVRVAQVTFQAVAAAGTPTALGLTGKLTWGGSYVFSGTGTGSAVTIRLRGDVDVDCDVDVADMMLVAQVWDTHAGAPGFVAAYDADANGEIDILDIMNVAIYWGDACLLP